jgi:SAM-dependent methyltransferase
MGLMMTAQATKASNDDGLISHGANMSFSDIRERLENAENLTLPRDVTLELFEQMTQFELGQFLLQNKGLNGYWTSYLILYGPMKQGLTPLEKWVLEEAPAVCATRERFGIFQQQVMKHLQSNMTLASVPCGTMDDLLTLDFSGKDDIRLCGCDLDKAIIELARGNAAKYDLENCAEFSVEDAWKLKAENAFDILTSNGLNIYEKDDAKVTELYSCFANALKPGGVLITSFLTPPPVISKESTWRDFNPADLAKQKALFVDIIQAGWQCFRTETETREQLEKAGLKVLEVIYDKRGMFPTVVAQKPQ